MYLHIANECFDFLVFQLLTLYALQLKIFFPAPKSLSLLNPNNRNILHKNEHDCLFFQELKFFIVFNNLPKQILIASISSHLWDAICVLILSLRSFSFIFITTNLWSKLCARNQHAISSKRCHCVVSPIYFFYIFYLRDLGPKEWEPIRF